jgi:uncharacterized protein
MRQAFIATAVFFISCGITSADDRARQSAEATMLKAVVHINFGDTTRQEAGLKNIENILKEADDTIIEVVCHGEGLSLLNAKEAKHAELVQSLMKRRVQFAACENTMRKKSVKKEDLVKGSATVPSGALEVIRQQSQGYSYFRP